MLTSFFGKSTPLNFLWVSGYVLILGFIWFFKAFDGTIGSFEILTTGFAILLTLFSLFILEFTNRKNGLTQINSFVILLFGSIATLFPSWVLHMEYVLANVFLLLALRRIFSLKSSKNTAIKVLDATLWITLASYCYFWSIWMILVLYIAIFLRPQNNRKLYVIPILGVMASVLIFYALLLILGEGLLLYGQKIFTISWDFSSFNLTQNLVSASFLLAVLIWALIHRFGQLGSIPKKEKPNYILVIFALAASLVILLSTHIKDTSTLLFIAPMCAVIIAGYVEKKNDIWFKEIILWLFVLLPVVRFII